MLLLFEIQQVTKIKCVLYYIKSVMYYTFSVLYYIFSVKKFYKLFWETQILQKKRGD